MPCTRLFAARILLLPRVHDPLEHTGQRKSYRSKLKSLVTCKSDSALIGRAGSASSKRRMAAKPDAPRRSAHPPPEYFAIATLRSFQLEGIPLNQSEFTHAVARGWGVKRAAIPPNNKGGP